MRTFATSSSSSRSTRLCLHALLLRSASDSVAGTAKQRAEILGSAPDGRRSAFRITNLMRARALAAVGELVRKPPGAWVWSTRRRTCRLVPFWSRR